MAFMLRWRRATASDEASRRQRPLRPGGQPYPYLVESKISKKKWLGPSYRFASQWRNDLMHVLEQARLTVKSNMPMGPAFAAAAEDYLHVETIWSPQRVARLFKIVGLSILLFLGVVAAVFPSMDDKAHILPRLIEPTLVAVWLYLTIRGHQYKPVMVLAALQSRLEAGQTLSEAMGHLPRFFPSDLVAFVRIGENTGKLGTILEEFSKESVKILTAQRALNKILWYIGLGLAIQFSVISFLWIKVVPVFYEVLNEMGRRGSGYWPSPEILIPLPSTNTLTLMVDFLHYTGAVFLALLLPLFLWFRKRRVRRSWASRMETTLLFGIPGLRGLVVRQNLASATYMLRHLLVAGVPLERALEAVAQADLHPLYRRCFARIRSRVLNGDSLRDACAGIHLLAPIPGSFVSMLAMAESTGELEKALGYLADKYYAEAERRRYLLFSCVLPAGVFLLGYIVLSIEMSIFKSMIALGDALIS